MAEVDLSCAEWRKSSHSSQSGNCVEVARNLPGLVAVRDAKTPEGAKLLVSEKTWLAFIRDIQATERFEHSPATATSRYMNAGL